MDAGGWETVGPKLTRVADALDWWHVVEGPIATTQFDADDRAFLAEAHPIAGTIDWAGDPWHALTGGLNEATGRKGKPLFLPLRPALTGRDSAPEHRKRVGEGKGLDVRVVLGGRRNLKKKK